MYRPWVVIALLAGVPACNDEAPDGTGMIIETVPDQPATADLGVSLAIHARGGRSVFVAVERGQFLTQTTSDQTASPQPPAPQPPAPQASVCMPDPTPDPAVPFTVALSVRPTQQEALLFASLYLEGDCSGTLVQSRIVAVHPPIAAPVPVDAGTPAPTDAGMPVAQEVLP